MIERTERESGMRMAWGRNLKQMMDLSPESQGGQRFRQREDDVGRSAGSGKAWISLGGGREGPGRWA